MPIRNPEQKMETVAEYHLVGGRVRAPAIPPTVTKTLLPGVYKIASVGFDLGFEPQDIVTDNLIRSGNSAAKEVIDEIGRFWTLKDKFEKFGFMHKRGFLLFGPPGTGKTSTLNHIMADTVERGGVVVIAPWDDPSVLTLMLTNFRRIEPDRQLVVVMEDLDNMLRLGEVGLLALLDGESSIDNVVYIATTNYLTRLPDRIANRPSRFDKKIEISGPNAAMRREYLESRNVTASKLELDLWVQESKGLSMAHLKELIISVAILGNELSKEAKRLRGKDLSDDNAET